ncbi:MAG: PilZ domain-containing protein [Pseudomonadota bacterium]
MPSDNIVELSSARASAEQAASAPAGNDQRLHPRLESDDRLFTQVVLSADDPELVGTTLSCTAVNLSVGGIQFRTSSSVPTGSLLDLWVDVSSRPGKFFLAGEVRWNRATGETDERGNDQWLVGVQLKSGAATDIMDWRDFHANAYAR